MQDVFEPHVTALLDALRKVLCQVAEPRSVLKAILQTALDLTGADRGLIVELGDGGDLEHRVLVGITAAQYEGPSGDFSRHLIRRVLERGDDVLLKSTLEDPYFQTADSIRAIGNAAVLCVPIRAGDRIAAIVHLEKRAIGGFDDSHRRVLRSLGVVAGGVLESLRATAEQQVLAAGLLRYEAAHREALKQDWAFGRFLGRSSAVRGLERTLRLVAARETPVLILGETGTGKSILARAIHFEGPRAEKALVTVFCPSLEKGLVESELFGHRRGTFTNAVADRVGKVQLADGGTLFLDEVGELPLELQTKLLRLLEEGTYEVVGDAREHKANVRIIAATNRDLAADVESGRFRDDLLARLDIVQIRVPPLRERVEDIGLLLRDCLDREPDGRWVTIAPEAIGFLERLPFSWPHNVRHLKRLAAQLAMETHDGPVSEATIARLLEGHDQSSVRRAARLDLEAGLPALMVEAEREWLREAIARYSNLSRAELAAKLKVSESTLYKKLADYGF